MYTVVGYEKDGDVYIALETGIDNKEQAILVAEEKASLLRAGKLCRADNGEHELRVW